MGEKKLSPAAVKYQPPLRETLEVAIMGGILAGAAGFAFTYGLINLRIDGDRCCDTNPLNGGLICGGCCFLLAVFAIGVMGRLPQSVRFWPRLFRAVVVGLGAFLIGGSFGEGVIHDGKLFEYSLRGLYVSEKMAINHAKADLNSFLVGTSCGSVVGISTFMLFQPPNKLLSASIQPKTGLTSFATTSVPPIRGLTSHLPYSLQR
jgi:hypothetical protein